MNSNKRMVTVGVFVVVALVIFIAGVLTLGGQKKTFERKNTLRAIFKDVGGLKEGNNVWFSGVKVGTVKKMSFAPNAMVDVVMSVESKAMPYIRKDSKARISSEGFIGNKIVVIFGGSTNAPQAAEDDTLGVDNGVSTDEMMSTLQQNNKNLLDITGNLKEVTQRLLNGQGSAGKLLNDETLIDQMQLAVLGFKKASVNVQNLTADIAGYTSKLQSKGSLTNELINDTVFYSKLKATATEVQNASVTIRQASDNIKIISDNLKTVSNSLNSPETPAGVLLSDREAGKDVKTTLANLQTSSKKLDEDLEALQHNFLLRGFFKKKAKSEQKK